MTVVTICMLIKRWAMFMTLSSMSPRFACNARRAFETTSDSAMLSHACARRVGAHRGVKLQ